MVEVVHFRRLRLVLKRESTLQWLNLKKGTLTYYYIRLLCDYVAQLFFIYDTDKNVYILIKTTTVLYGCVSETRYALEDKTIARFPANRQSQTATELWPSG